MFKPRLSALIHNQFVPHTGVHSLTPPRTGSLVLALPVPKISHRACLIHPTRPCGVGFNLPPPKSPLAP